MRHWMIGCAVVLAAVVLVGSSLDPVDGHGR